MDLSLHKKYQEIESFHWWFKGRRALICAALQKIFGGKTNSVRLLDFGCNSGYFVEELRKDGYETYGVDVSSEAIEYGVSRGAKKLFAVGVGEKLPFMNNYFDVALALDVLEHIEDDRAALTEIIRVLKPGGAIIATVPALPFLWGIQDEVSHHFRRYARKELTALFEKTGLKIERLVFFNFFLFLPVAVVRLMGKVILPKRKSDFELNNKWTNFILTKIFLFEVWLLRYIKFPWGISLLIMAKKR
jgi:SAM-dependent methyltransferase